MNTTETTLYSYRADSITLEEALSNCKGQLSSGIALIYSPQACQLAIVKDDGTLHNSSGQKINLDDDSDFFEVRVFNLDCELRWLNYMDGVGNAVLLSESEQESVKFSALVPQSCEFIEQQYLLWGEKAKNQPTVDGWRRLAEARIGKLDIPLKQSFDKNQRVYLRTREYLAADNNENFGVVEERLVKLEVA